MTLATVTEADVQTQGIEEADVDTATVRVETRRPNVDARKQVGVPNGLVGRHAPYDFGDIGRHLRLGQQSLLLAPVLRGRSGNRFLAEHDPAGIDLVDLCERLLGIPATFLRVEVVALEATDLKERHGAAGSSDQHVAVVATPLEHPLRGHGVAELRELIVCIDNVLARLHDFLGGNEIPAEKVAGKFVINNS